jgi:hypothetical protein
MKKPWSITTTVRNPERLRDFLIVLKELEGEKWDKETQKLFQILLIKNRLYGYGSQQFYNDLDQADIAIFDNLQKDLTFEFAQEVFYKKNYTAPAMRGRQSFNPLKKFGLATIKDNKIKITDLGEMFLREDYDIGEIFFRSLLKWQIPNPLSRDYKKRDGYNLRPLLGTFHLIKRVNEICLEREMKIKGLSKEEFSIFCPALINYKEVERYAKAVIELRELLEGQSKEGQETIKDEYVQNFLREVFEAELPNEMDKLLNNLKDYGDNTLRYFRLTRYLNIRGGGFYIDLEPRREVEITELLKFEDGSAKEFTNKEEYIDYLSDIKYPELPWETKAKLTEIASKISEDIYKLKEQLKYKEEIPKKPEEYSVESMKNYIEVLRGIRRSYQNHIKHIESQNINAIKEYIDILNNIWEEDNRPIKLEKYTTLALRALNDAIDINPNYPVGDDNEPTFTAPANKADIECYYEGFNTIAEVTMLRSRDQWFNEGQPVMRHLRDFEEEHKGVDNYCVFVAPSIHTDTINTFWVSVKYGYDGKKQKIVPLKIEDLIQILEFLVMLKENGKSISHTNICDLYIRILNKVEEVESASQWVELIPDIILNWQESLL